MFNEYQLVKIKESYKNIPAESIGTILMVHESDPNAYEVEFIDEKGNFIAVETLLESQLETVNKETET